MARHVATAEVTATELLDAHLGRIAEQNPKINAFVYIDAQGAKNAAKRADEAVTTGAQLGPLHGVPVTIKSSIDVAGFPCETGSRLRKGNIASQDAPLVRRLRQAGAIILGNTNVPELLMAWETENALYGRTNNPHDLTRTPGGSSGGESAAIAAYCSAAGIGSDGGGSVRVPAHFCGIAGLKPTPGRVPSTGHFPASAGPFALLGVVGPMARTVEDVEAVFNVIAGHDDGDPMAAPVPLRRWTDAERKGLRVGYFEDDGHTPVTRETRQAVQDAAAMLERAGFQVERFRPDYLDEARDLWWNIFVRIGDELLSPMLAGHDDEISDTLREYRGWQRAQPRLTKDEVLATWLGRDGVRARLLADMHRYPILLSPVASIPAYRHGERRWNIDGETVEYLDAMRYSQWVNLTGNPALSVPVAKSREGMPIGVQLIGRPWEEELVLAVGRALEREMPPDRSQQHRIR
jgi:Asp-tRNA(Asn)/Glu-tRNA(Gln) amidotransferase A subunit family amidase